MDTVRRTLPAALAAGALVLAALSPTLALAQAGSAPAPVGTAPTAIRIGAPASAELGKPVTLQAILVDGAGSPIAGAPVVFTSPETFLNRSGDTVVASATTAADGRAMTTYAARDSGTVTIRAEFHGDAHHAPAMTSAAIGVTGDRQLHVENVGVRIPGLNEPPLPGSVLAAANSGTGLTPLIVGLWPAMTVWPIAAVLIIVWSLYAFAVALIYRVASAGAVAPGERVAEAGTAGTRATGRLQPRIPLGIATGVGLLAVLLLTIAARSPYTHANLATGVDARYTRTDQTVVGAPGPFMAGGSPPALPPASDPVARGRALFVTSGCAGCHGIEGRGSWAPTIVGTDAATLRAKALKGPGGMPAQPEHRLSDADFTAVAAYLKAMSR